MKKTLMLGAVVAAASLSGSAAVIDFEADTLGLKPNGWSPVGHPTVQFSDTAGTDLLVGNFGGQGIGQSLAVFDDTDGSKLQIDFTVPVDSLSLWFGNDDPGWAGPTDLAWLEIWNGAVLLATVNSPLNLDDIMNQNIGWAGQCFDRAYFWYGDAQGNPFTTGPSGAIGLIEIVDRIEYVHCQRVPEGGSSLMLLGIAGLGMVGLGRRWIVRS
ncbi:MAG: hypothetical protein WHT82_02080 [Limisphaera sp.]